MMQKAKKNNPNLKEERKLWQRGYKFVVGLDEVGRGPLAGPVCAAAVCFFSKAGFVIPARFAKASARRAKAGIQNFKSGSRIPEVNASHYNGAGKCGMTLKDIRDSKKLTPRQREKWYEILTNHPTIKWGVGLVSEKIIDKINILEATKLAMKKAIEALEYEADYLLLDGNFILEDISINQKAIIRGDERIISCAAASIIAKVTRDRLMERYHKKFPLYGFDRHKGYGTKRHFEEIQKHGPCKIHRLSFAPFVN
jgi:ribonuclease HII